MDSKKRLVVVLSIVLIIFINVLFIQGQLNSTATATVSLTIEGVQRGWTSITGPEGIFEPVNASLSGTHVNTFSIKFNSLTIDSTDVLDCDLRLPDGTIKNVSETGLSVSAANYYMDYTVLIGDQITDDSAAGYLPWILKNCSLLNASGGFVKNESVGDRVYVHNPVYWTDNEITRAVACEGSPGVFFNNSAKCEFSEDTMLALQMRNGNPVNESCFNNPGVACADNYCNGIFFPTCDTLSYFGGYSAATDDPNGYANFSVSFGSYDTPIGYTRYTNTSNEANFKLRVGPQALTSKTFTITIYNLTNVSGANIYGDENGSGKISVVDNNDNTWNVAYNRLNSGFTGTLDFIFNISFNEVQNKNQTLKFVLAYGTDTNQGTPSYFEETFSSVFGLTNNDESENTSITTDVGGVCGDEANNDFDCLTYGCDYSYDCFDSDCNLSIGDENQTNEFGSEKTGICYYQKELNCSDSFDNDYDYILSPNTDFTDCHDADCFNNGDGLGTCPVVETVCNDSVNNDWDYAPGDSNSSSSQKIGNNGTKYNWTYTSDITDCEDIDCNGSVGGGAGELCNWGYETACNDGFNNDALQLFDCVLSNLTSSTNLATPAYGEYDCASYCRTNNISSETGATCDDNYDNDLDAVVISGYYSNEYSANSSYGAGVDCRWGGYFDLGTNYNPDEDCDNQTLNNGYVCQLSVERNCTDSFDNDFDADASGMPRAGWSADTSGYLSYFGYSFLNDADFDDYDCGSNSLIPTNESINASWCFDSIDNDLDMYYLAGNWTPNSSTGMDCADPNCLGITSPANSNLTCLIKEYDPDDSFFTSLPFPGLYCSNGADDDADGPIDCNDTDCYQQFDRCSAGPCFANENTNWSSCSNSFDDDSGDGIDCADSDCVGMLGNVSGGLCQSGTETQCDDDVDNDADGDIDCGDSNCAGSVGDKINNISVYCRVAESSTADCFDGFDNDRDGDVDCNDNDCNDYCGLSNVSGSSATVMPVLAGQTSINSVSDAIILEYTSQVREGQYYNITFNMSGSSSDAQWTLGTASGTRFNKSAFNISTAYLEGPNANNFTITETVNGFIVDSDSANLANGYTVSFLILSNGTLDSSTYELTYAESTGSKTSLNNYVQYQVNENIAPAASTIRISRNSSVVYGESVYLRANVSDDNFAYCDWSVDGAGNSNPANSTTCKGLFAPIVEGVYNINVTPVDQYYNEGSAASQSITLTIIPSGAFVSTNDRFYSNSESMEFNSSFNAATGDTISSCLVIAKDSSGTESILGSGTASGVTCNASSVSLSGLSDGVYSVYSRVVDSDGDIGEGLTKAVFICSQNSSGICRFSDFNTDGNADACVGGVFPTPSCTIGDEVTEFCTCDGSEVNEGYCCSAGWQNATCPTISPAAPTAAAGGSSGLSSFDISDKEIGVDSFKKELKKIKIIIINTGNRKTEFSFSSDLEFVFLPDDIFINAGEEKEIEFIFRAPDEAGIYKGIITIEGDGVVKQLPVVFSVSETALFDIFVTVLPGYKNLKYSKEVVSEIRVINLGDADRLATLDYYVTKDTEFEKISKGSEIIAVEAGQELRLMRNLSLSRKFKPGNYKFYADLGYDDVIVIASDNFKILGKAWEFWILIVAFLVVVSTMILVLIKYFMDKGIMVWGES